MDVSLQVASTLVLLLGFSHLEIQCVMNFLRFSLSRNIERAMNISIGKITSTKAILTVKTKC